MKPWQMALVTVTPIALAALPHGLGGLVRAGAWAAEALLRGASFVVLTWLAMLGMLP